MPSYDASHFEPAAPVAVVTLRNPLSGATVSDVLLLVDTGVDEAIRNNARDSGYGMSWRSVHAPRER